MAGHRLRIAQLGVSGDNVAASLEEVVCGVGCYWVEIDGHRFDAIVSATFGAIQNGTVGDEITVPTVTLEIIGPVEIVYVGNDAEPLPGDSGFIDPGPHSGESFDADTRR